LNNKFEDKKGMLGGYNLTLRFECNFYHPSDLNDDEIMHRQHLNTYNIILMIIITTIIIIIYDYSLSNRDSLDNSLGYFY